MKHIRNRLILIAVLTAAAVYFALPTLTKDQAGGWRKILPRDGMRLGLDLQGGMHLIQKVNLARNVQNHLELSITDPRQALREKQIAIGRPEAIGANRMRLPITDPSAAPKVKQVMKEGFPYFELAAENAGYLEVRLKEKELADIEENAVTQR